MEKMMVEFIKGESFPFAVTTDKMVASSQSFTHVIRKHHCSPAFPSLELELPQNKSLRNNKCCKCSSKSISFPRRRINGLTTIMFLASYLLIFTVVTTSFVTSQPVVGGGTSVTNLQARNKLMMKMKTETEKAAGKEATIPIQISTPSSSSSYPSFSSLPTTSSFYSDDDSTKNEKASFSPTADVPTGKQFAKHKSPQKSPWSTVLPPLASISSKLSLDQVENFGKGKETTTSPAAEFSVNNIGNHADSPLSSSSSLSPPLTQTVTEKYIGQLPLNMGEHASSRKDVENNEMEIKVGLARDKGKVMVTDDVKGSSLPFPSSSKVNPVSSSFSSGNSHAALLPTAETTTTNDDDDDVDKAVVKEKKGIKANIITLKDKEEEEMEDKRRTKIRLHSKLNLLSNLNKSQRFMSTTKRMMEEEATTSSSFQKQDEMMIVTTASSNRQKEDSKTGSDVRGDDDGGRDRGEYANDVNNHVNFVDGNYNQPTTEIQGGFDTDYSNKRRDFTTTDDSSHESLSNGSSKSTSSSSPDSNSTGTPGNFVKSTRHFQAEKMNISFLSFTFPEVVVPVDNVAIEKKKENEKEEEDKVHQKKNKNSDNMSQSYNHIYNFSNDSPAAAVMTGDEEEEREDNWKSPFSTKTSPLLMNKWITTLVKLSQCRANCLDQAGIHQWDSLQSDLLEEEHQLGSTATDNQKEGAIATTIAPPTPNWSDLLNKKENLYSSQPAAAAAYLEQMKELTSNPLSTTAATTTTTPQRTIKVTPSKSMKYYELSNCQQLCRNNFPIHRPNLIVHESNGYYDDDSFNFPNNKAEQSLTGEDKKENKEQVNRSNNDNSSKSSSASSSTPAGNKNNGNNGSNNNNTNNNDEKNIERTYPKEKITPPVERERSSWDADRKTNNNNYHSLIPQEKVEYHRHPQQHYFPYSMSSSTSSFDSSKRKSASGGKYDGDSSSNDLQPLMKLLAIEQVSHENNNKKEPHSWRSATGLLNNLKTFPSDPGLKVRQLSLRETEEKRDKDENDDQDGVASTFSSTSLNTPTLQLSLSWPKPTSIYDPGYEDDAADDDNDKDKNNKPEEAFSAQVKDKKGIHFGGGGGDDGRRADENKRIGARPALGTGISLERNSSSSKKPITLVYSIILEESWENSEKDGNLDMYPYARRWQLIDQIVARTTTQISLPLTIVQEKVPTEQEKNGEERNNKGKMSLNEQKVVRTKRISPSGSPREGEEAGALEQKKGEIIKVNESKKNYLLNGMVEERRMMMMTPLPPTPLQDSMDKEQNQQDLLKKKTADPPSKVTVRVLAVSRQGLEKVYSVQVKVNNSFWDYHMNEHDHNQRKVYRENLNQTTERASWTHAASDSHNNIEPPISSSPIAFGTTTKFENDDDHHRHQKDDDVDGEEGRKRKETGNQKKEEVDKLGSENEKKVDDGKKKDENEKSGNFNESNENSNQILVFPSKESLRQTLGGGRGLSGELKVKKLMSRLKQKKKSENEVDSRVTNKLAVKPAASGKEVERKQEDLDDQDEKKDGNINRMNGVSSPKKKISLTDDDEGLDQVKDEERENWGLHTVSMIYQKFLVVTQVTWDYPGEMDGNQGTGNILANNGMTRSGLGNESNFKFAETTGKNNFSSETPLSSGAPNKKWRGCGGNRASNSNDGDRGNGGVDGGKQLNFLLSWEIFGGGLRGNLVTDTCSASISLWPDTAYIIQVGLITPNKEDDSMKTTKTNGQDSAYFPSYLAALQSSYIKKGNISSNHVHSKILGKSSEVRVENSEIVHEGGGGGSSTSVTSSTPTSTTTDDPSSFDPLVLPESITFPFDGEPKVTIKSERILVNTTRAGGSSSSKSNFVDDDVTTIIRNQDKVTPGNSQSNNNFLPGKKEKKWYSNSLEQPAAALTKMNNVGGVDGESKQSSSAGVSGGINDKVNVSPIAITRNGYFEENGPAFEEQSVFAAEEENDQPEQESPHHPPPPSPPKKQAAAVNEDDTDQQYNSSVWDDDNDEDEATDQDESLFARSLAHQNHHLHENQKHFPSSSKRDPPPTHYNNRPVSLPQAHTQVLEQVEAALKQEQQQQQRSTPPVESKKFHSYMTVNSFYQSLYALSRNVLKLNHRYPQVISITNEGNADGGNKNGNGSSTSQALSRTGGGDPNVGPLLIGEFTNSNHTGYLFTTTHTGGDDEDSSGIKGKLYTLFVILVISFVVFLFVVAIVGFCVLTSSIKENYKYFVPKKVRVWTTVGQLLKGHNSSEEGGASSSTSGGGGREGFLFKDSAEGSFYPRRLQEEPDYEFDDNEDVDPDDEDDEDEEVTSIADTDDEEEDGGGGGGLEESECDCQCRYVIDNEIVEEEDENSFSLNERYTSSSSDRVKLIRDGEENSVELMACIDEDEDERVEGESERNSCSYKNSKCFEEEEESDHHHHHHHCHSGGNCDNNNPCYRTIPGGCAARTLQSAQPPSKPSTVKSSPVAAALSSLKKNFHRVSSSSAVASQQQQQLQHHRQQQQQQRQHHPHCHHYQNSQKRKSDTRIDVTGSSSGRHGRSMLVNQRQEGYY